METELTTAPTAAFYDLFARAGDNVVAAARLAERMFEQFPDDDGCHQQIKQLEHDGDELTGEIVHLLHVQHEVPFQREQVYELAKAVDDVLDFIEEASDRLVLYQVPASMQQSIDQCRVLAQAAEQLALALRDLRAPDDVPDHLRRMKQLEDEGDRIVRRAIADLFVDEDTSPRTIIQWKDIFEALEQGIDACETAGHVIGNVVLQQR